MAARHSSNERVAVPDRAVHLFTGGGELGGLVREFDWSATPLGAPATWSPTLRMMVSFLLANRFPLLLWWGPEYIQIYNDAYRPVLGTKHPHAALGQPVRECWHEIWNVIGPLIDTPFNGGPATWMEDIELEINRHGFTEESHFTIAYSPVPDETAPNGIGGVLATVHEITEKVIGQRRVALLKDVGARIVEPQSAEEACIVAADTLKRYPKDVPFALMYLLEADGVTLRRVCEVGNEIGPRGPELLKLESTADARYAKLRAALQSETIQVLEQPAELLGGTPLGPWADPPSHVVAVPIKSNVPHRPAGVLLAGASPRIALDSQYLTFFELLTSQIATAVANARALEEEHKRAEALAEIDRAKTAFFSNVSHEFRTPLTLIFGPIEEAAANPSTPPPVRAQLELARRNSLRLLKLVNTLLDFSRIEAGRVQASYEPTDLAALTRDLASTFRSAIDRAGLRYAVECVELEEPVYVDRGMWEKIVLNLLSNAFKFTLEGTISVRLRREGDFAQLEVSDTGAGIPDHELPRLFERFHRVEGTVGRTQEGSGIGLALVQELVRLHGGVIDAVSKLGAGTTFRVRVALGTAHLPPERIKGGRTLAATAVGAQAFVQEALRWIPTEPATARGELSPILESMAATEEPRLANIAGARILLADDNADMRSYVRALLANTFEVETVSDGEQALAAARRRRPDLVLSDIMMPRLDGLALLKALRADEALRDVPIILLSARAGEEARVAGLTAGADDYLVKPFSARELLARVTASLTLARNRRDFDQALRASEEKYRNLFANMAEEVHFWQLVRDEAGDIKTWRLVDINPAGLKSWRKTRAETIGKTADEIFPGATAHFMPLVTKIFAEGAPHSWDSYFPALDQFLHITSVPLGEFFITTGANITAMKKAERLLQAADRQKDEFLAMLAHELRNPLAAIRYASEVLNRSSAADPQSQSPLGILARQTRQLSRLVDDLLDISRIAQGRIVLTRKHVEIGEVLGSAVEAVQPLLCERSQELVIEKPDEPIHVDGDHSRLVQSLGNVLTNAAKYTGAGGRIRLEIKASEKEVQIRVIDNGCGISPELLPHVFDLFVQSERTLDRSQGGLGIGLSVVKRLIEMHGGSVSAESAGVGCGTTVTMRLPRLASPAQTALVPRQLKEKSSRRVLVVDDNRDAADSMTILLARLGHQAEAVYSAQAALEAAERLRPDFILLDIGLPGMDGYEVARRLREIEVLQSTRLVALTGYGPSEDRERAKEAGFAAHLVKPAGLEELEGILAGDRRRLHG